MLNSWERRHVSPLYINLSFFWGGVLFGNLLGGWTKCWEKQTQASRESYDVPHVRKVSKCLVSSCPSENSHHLWYQCLEKDHVLWRRSCHRRCGVSYPVYVCRYVGKTGGMDTSARFSHCQGCEPHILWTSDHIRTRPGRVELSASSSVWEGPNFRYPPMWVEVTLPVYGGNLPTAGTFSPKLLIWWSDFCQKCQKRLWYHMAEARHHMWGQPIVPWGAEQSDSHGRNMWIS